MSVSNLLPSSTFSYGLSSPVSFFKDGLLRANLCVNLTEPRKFTPLLQACEAFNLTSQQLISTVRKATGNVAVCIQLCSATVQLGNWSNTKMPVKQSVAADGESVC